MGGRQPAVGHSAGDAIMTRCTPRVIECHQKSEKPEKPEKAPASP
jgi:hypothetical protein